MSLYSFCLRTVDFSNFDTSEMDDMGYMFRSSIYLTSITWGSTFNTSKVKYMNNTFQGCFKLRTINLNNFVTNNVVTMFFMFTGCISTETLDLSSFKSNALKDASSMFYNCENLTKIDLRNFDGNNLTSKSDLFSNLGGSGTLIYNSSIMNPEILKYLPKTWNKTDVNV